MKKEVTFLFIGSVLIFGSIIVSQNKKVILERISKRTITPTATSEIIEPTEGKEQNDYKIIIDEMGKQRKLYLGDLDVKREGVFFKYSNPTSLYSQLSDGHYYYMRSDGKGNYKIYRDKGKKVGGFSLRRGYAKYFIKHKDKFFLCGDGNHLKMMKNMWTNNRRTIQNPVISIIRIWMEKMWRKLQNKG